MLAIFAITAAVIPPAFGQAVSPVQRVAPRVSVKLPVQVTRMQNIKPGFINNLAGLRMVAITNSQGIHLRSAPMKKFLASQTGPKRNQVSTTAFEDPEATEYGIRPVAYSVPIALPMSVETLDGLELRYVVAPRIESTAGGMKFADGNFFLTATRSVNLELPGANVELQKGAVIKVSCSAEGGRIINVLDQNRDSVVVRICQKVIALRPGEECHYSKSPEFCAKVPHDGCGRREAKNNSCCDWSITTNEVAIAALFKHDPIGRQIYRSDAPSDVRIKKDALKMAAALANWTKNKKPYSWN